MVGCEWDGLQILDVSIPAQLRRIGAYYTDSPVWGVAHRGELAFLTLGAECPGLEIVDVGNPSTPSRVALISMKSANRVRLVGSYACITGDGLTVVDVADPYHPVRAGQHRLGDNSTGGLQVVGDLVYVAAGDYGLAIYRVTPQLKLDQPVIDAQGIHLSWLGGPGIRLQRATRLSPPDWQDVPNTEGLSRAQLPATGSAGFYRLRKQ